MDGYYPKTLIFSTLINPIWITLITLLINKKPARSSAIHCASYTRESHNAFQNLYNATLFFKFGMRYKPRIPENLLSRVGFIHLGISLAYSHLYRTSARRNELRYYEPDDS